LARVVVALGSNLGDRGETIQSAMDALEAIAARQPVSRSSLHWTTPIGGPQGQSEFINAAVSFETSLEPHKIHEQLLRIEADHGRVRNQRWAARTLDLDLLLYDSQIIQTPTLQVPHPRMTFRRFVMDPASEAAPSMIHPRMNQSLAEIATHLRTTQPLVSLIAVPGPSAFRLLNSIEEAASLNGFLDGTSEPDWSEPLDAVLNGLLASPASCDQEEKSGERSSDAKITWDAHLKSRITGNPPFQAPTLPAADLPRLTVWWLRSAKAIFDESPHWFSQGEAQQVHERLVEQSQRLQQTPYLILQGDDWQSSADEIVAAIEAML